MPRRVRITDVSPRDGLQNEPGVIPTADKIRLVHLLCATGVDEIEVTSFVSPKWVPQLGDASEVLAALRANKPKGMCFSALVPNERGMEALLAVNESAGFPLVDKVSVFTAASETFSRKNTNATIDQTIERFEPVLTRASDAGLAARLYLSCAIACPFEGPISPQRVARVARRLLWLTESITVQPRREQGTTFSAVELDLGDTIGAATPGNLKPLIEQVGEQPIWNDFGNVPASIVLHLHDTHGRAAECVRTALDLGVRSFDGSVAGLGGCPYASAALPDGTTRRAPGNISTETLVRTVHEAGFTTGVDLAALEHAAAFAREIVEKSRGRAS
jgi:hydroxymethylglutaryl-CoA lyase